MAVKVRRQRSAVLPEPQVFMAAGGFAGAVAVAAGLYEQGLAHPRLAAFLAVALLGLALWYGRLRHDHAPPVMHGQQVAPLIWVVIAWMAYRFFFFVSPNVILLPAAVVAWLFTAYAAPALVGAFFLVALMEIGLTLFGHQTFSQCGANVAVYGAAGFGLTFFASSKAHRKKMKKELARVRRDAENEEYARDFGLLDEAPDILAALPAHAGQENPDRYSKPALELINAAFANQLALTRETLELTTVALLWPDPGKEALRVRSRSSRRNDLLDGPFPVGAGITGALVGAQQEVAASRARGSLPPVPYYRRQDGVGSVFALRIPSPDGKDLVGFEDRNITPILCADRETEAEWDEAERVMLRQTAAKLAQDLVIGKRLQVLENERSAFQRVCIALRELNSVLGLEQVLQATIRAVKLLVEADFVAISLVDGDQHRIAMAAGGQAESLQGLEFSKEEGLVGQAMKINRTLPAKAECHGPMPVFSSVHRLSGYQSLLVIPLRKDEDAALGVLTIASQAAGLFTKTRQDILELIAAQVAVKIDLGRAHEQINRMATTDGLTGLANHRTFQHGLDIMLERAGRRGGSLCLIMADIDHFKQLNDSHGHPFGDQVLRRVAELLLSAVRTVDLAARYGGEEFAVVLEDSDRKGGITMAERIRREVELLTLRHERDLVQVTLSLGLAVFPENGREKAELIGRADQALYRAKQLGRNRVVGWEAAGFAGRGG